MNFFDLPVTEQMMRSQSFCEGVACLARLGLSFDAWVVFTQLADVAYLARAVPDATIVLDHAGTPLGVGIYDGRHDEVFHIWKGGMTEVAACPNVVVKIGGLLMHNTGLVPHGLCGRMSSEQVANALRRYVLTTIDLFSPARCMFESNFPIDGAYVSYGNLWNGFKRLVADLCPAERSALFAGTAGRIYRLSI
jgi:predicted TIM-barrel fold metal-dependent hydrolase